MTAEARQGPPLPQLQASVPTLLQALSASETSAPQLIIEAASPCKILLANKAWCDLTGFASEELVGNSVSMLHGPLTCGETLTALGMSMGAGQSLRTPQQLGATQFFSECLAQLGALF